MPQHNLHSRTNSGTTVSLDWDSDTEEISVHVTSATEDFILYPPNDRALECFYHPFAMAQSVLATGRYDRAAIA